MTKKQKRLFRSLNALQTREGLDRIILVADVAGNLKVLGEPGKRSFYKKPGKSINKPRTSTL